MTWEDWLKLAGIGAGAATNLYGAHVASNAANQQNQQVQQQQQQLTQIAEQERQRRDALTQLFMPSLLRDMGVRSNSGQLGALFQQAGGGQAKPMPSTLPDQGGANSQPGLMDDEWMRQFGPRGSQTGYAGGYQGPGLT